MKYESLKRYAPSAVPGDKGRGLIVTLEPSEDGEAVLIKDLPQKIPVTQGLPDSARGETVIVYFKDGTHTFACWIGEPQHWNVIGHGPLDEGDEDMKVVAWRRIMT